MNKREKELSAGRAGLSERIFDWYMYVGMMIVIAVIAIAPFAIVIGIILNLMGIDTRLR